MTQSFVDRLVRLAVARHIRLAIAMSLSVATITLPAHGAHITKVISGQVDRFLVTPDGGRLIYRIYDEGNAQLLSQPIDGSATAVRLDDPTAPVGSFQVTPDGTRVVYRSGSDLHGRLVDGSGQLASYNSGTSIDLWQISPDSSHVVYRHNISQLFSRPIDGSVTSNKLSGPLIPGGLLYGEILVTADSSRVIYKAQQQPDDVSASLYSSPIDGSTIAVRLNNPLGTNQFIRDGVRLTPDGQTAIFRVSHTQNFRFSLIYRRPTDGSETAVQLNSQTDVPYFPTLSPDGAMVAHIAATATSQNQGVLFTSPVQGDGYNSIEISDPTQDVAGGILFTPDSTRLIYRQFDNVTNHSDLFSRPTDASDTAVKLSNDGVSEQYVDSHYQITSDSSQVIYTRETNQDISWYASPVDGSANPTLLHQIDLSEDHSFDIDFELTQDGQFAIVMVRVDVNDVNDHGLEQLFAMSTSNGNTMSLLNASAPNAFTSIDRFSIGPDSRTIYYLADQDTLGTYELFAATIPESFASPVPEPGSATLLLVALGGIMMRWPKLRK